jgi:hypothetical protein
MNHALMFRNIHPARLLDFNSVAFMNLDELQLTDGPIPTVDGMLSVRPTVFGVLGSYATVDSVADPIDWGLNGIDPGVSFSQDVNRLIGLCEDDSIDLTQSDDTARDGGRLAVLRGFADWDNIQFAFRSTADFADGARRITPSDVPEITGAQARAVAGQVDFDEDGIANHPDNCPAHSNPGQGDSDEDGIGDACDGSAPANRVPAAAAGSDRSVEAGSSAGAVVSLDASGSSDPDGDVLSYTWTGPFGTLTGATIAPVVPLGIHVMTVTVEDGKGGTAADTVEVTVHDTTAPAVTAPANITVTATETAGARGSSSTILAAFLAGGTASDAVDPSPQRFNPQVNGTDAGGNTLFPAGTTSVTFRFADASGNVGSAGATVTVVSRNLTASGTGAVGRDPVADFFFVAGYRLQAGAATLYGEATFNAGNLQFRSTSLLSLAIGNATAELSGYGRINQTGNYSFVLTAKDAAVSGGPAADTFQITIRDAATGLAVYTSGPERPIDAGKIVIK